MVQRLRRSGTGKENTAPSQPLLPAVEAGEEVGLAERSELAANTGGQGDFGNPSAGGCTDVWRAGPGCCRLGWHCSHRPGLPGWDARLSRPPGLFPGRENPPGVGGQGRTDRSRLYMFLYVSVCFYMLLYVSIRFCMFLYVSCSSVFRFRVQPKFQGCFPLVSGGHWSWGESRVSLCAPPSSVLPTAPSPPQKLFSHLSDKGPARGDTGGKEKHFGDVMLGMF